MENQGKTSFTLLAISKLYNTRVNLVGIDENHRWIRPMPVYQSDIFAQEEKDFRGIRGYRTGYSTIGGARHPGPKTDSS